MTKEQEDYIIKNYSTMETSEIAKKLGYSISTIRYHAEKYNLKRPNIFLNLCEEDSLFIQNNYLTMSYTDIGEHVGLTPKQVRGWIYNHIDNRELKTRQFNKRYFKNIDSPTKAYWLGYIYADGWIVSNNVNRNYEFGMELQRRDEYILRELNDCLGGVHYIKNDHHERIILNNKNISITDSSILRVYSKDIVNDLYSNGIDFNKTYSDVFPIVNDEYFLDFLRGYMDGDGCIHVMNTKFNLLGVHITSANKKVLEYINNKLNELYQIETSIYKENDRKYRIYWFAADKVRKLLNLLYDDCNTPYLKRKFEIYKNFYGLAS